MEEPTVSEIKGWHGRMQELLFWKLQALSLNCFGSHVQETDVAVVYLAFLLMQVFDYFLFKGV